MRKIIGTLLGVCMLSACGSKPGNSDQLGANIKLYNPADIANFVEMQMIPKSDVLDSIRMLQKSMATSYVGYNVKKELIGRDGDQIFAECLKSVEQGPDRVKSFKLYDHVLECLAGFQDTHISISTLMTPATVATGIAISTVIEGKLYISGLRPNLIKKIEEVQKLETGSLAKKLSLGNEIISIDGAPAANAIAKLQKYVSSSSPKAALEDTAGFLFTRNFSYPENNEITLQIKGNGDEVIEVTLPWVLHSFADSTLETRSVLAGKGIQPMELAFGPDKALMTRKEFSYGDPLFSDLTAKRSFNDSKDTAAMTLGLKSINNKNYCYMQLNTFMLDHSSALGYKIYETINEKSQEVSFDENVKNFLKSCESFKAPLILDLRVNNGGDPGMAEVLYEYFETAQTPQTYRVVNLLNNSGNLAYINGTQDQADKAEDNLFSLLHFQALKNSFDKKAPLSDWIALKKTREKSLFTGPLSILTSPSCVSSCDGITNRMKLSGRARIFGTHTNGTGFGFAGETEFKDHLRLYTVKLPNRSFQNTIVESDKDFAVEKDLKGSVISLDKVQIIENRPAQPDVIIDYTLKDMIEKFPDYIAKLTTLLDPLATN